MFAYEIEAEARRLERELPQGSMFVEQLRREWLPSNQEQTDDPFPDDMGDGFRPAVVHSRRELRLREED